MTMSGSPYSVSPLPNVVIAHEDYAQFDRLLAQGITPRVSGRVDNTLGTKPVTQWNTVGEIRGPSGRTRSSSSAPTSTAGTSAPGPPTTAPARWSCWRRPGSSWQSGLKPKRTIRFILFSGEEEGLLGSAAYAAQHAGEADKVQAVLVLDNGTGMITGMALQGRNQDAQLWTDLLAPVARSVRARCARGTRAAPTTSRSFPTACPAGISTRNPAGTTTPTTRRSTPTTTRCRATCARPRRSWR